MPVVAKMYIKKTAITGTPNVKTRSTATGPNWGSALSIADDTDFVSTNEFDHGNTEMSGTGWVEIILNANYLVPGANNYFRLQDNNYLNYNTESITFASTNNATLADRPRLDIVGTPDVTIISITKSLAYKIRRKLSLTKSLKYLIRRSRSIALSLEYKIRVRPSGHPPTILTTDKKPIVLQHKVGHTNLSTKNDRTITGKTIDQSHLLSAENRKSVIINKDSKTTLQASEKNTILNAKANKKILTSRNNPSVIKSSKEDVTKLGTKNQDKTIL